MKTIKILFLTLITLAIASCEKDEVELYNSADLRAPIVQKEKKGFYPPNKSVSLKFNRFTKEDQMGRFAATEMVEFHSKIWSVGGYLHNRSYPHQANGVWSSTNGYNWRSEVFNAFDSRVGHTLTVFDNKMWVIGGVNNAGHQLSDVWYSSDGLHWTLATNTAAFGVAVGHNTIVFKGRMFVFKKRDIWSSSDGINWSLEASDICTTREYTDLVVFKDKMYLIGGEHRAATFFNEIYVSDNGSDWSLQSTAPPIFQGISRFSTAVYKDKVWVIGGNTVTGFDSDEIWYSEDMKNWCKYGGTVPLTRISSHASLVFRSQIMVFGGFDSYGMSGSIWSVRQY
ncbi:hypothetical protein N9954_06625 [Maribacter sp.]|nr:hypothetical protein [Maribacter sp.]